MARTKTLQSQLRDVALEYMKQVAKLLNRDPRDCHWVGTDDHERGIYTICDLGDITFLTLDQMQVIIDRLPEWLERYGNRKAVAQEIDDWMEWSIQEENMLDGHPRINLEHWLMGCPRKLKLETTIHTLTIAQAIEAMQASLREFEASLTELEASKRIEDEAAFEKIKDTEAYKHFRKMMEGEK